MNREREQAAGRDGATNPAPDLVIEATGGATLGVPAGFNLLAAAFERAGPDLILTDPSGTIVLVRGFFAASPLPDLAAGGAVLSGALVATFAGPATPGAHAQAVATTGA